MTAGTFLLRHRIDRAQVLAIGLDPQLGLQRQLRLRRSPDSRARPRSAAAATAPATSAGAAGRESPPAAACASGGAAIVAEAALELHVRRHRFFGAAGLLVNLAGQERGFRRGARPREVDDDLPQIGERLLVEVVGELRLRHFEQLRGLRVPRRGAGTAAARRLAVARAGGRRSRRTPVAPASGRAGPGAGRCRRGCACGAAGAGARRGDRLARSCAGDGCGAGAGAAGAVAGRRR